MFERYQVRPIEILLVEDNPGDVRLTIEALRDGKIENQLTVARDGVEAMALLSGDAERPYAADPLLPPDLILLDLNLPKKDGREVLAEIRVDPRLYRIPVAILTASHEEHDFLRAQALDIAGYLTKPVAVPELLDLVRGIDSLRLAIVTLVTA
jgi:CheY-like chemotaxis protein